MKKLDYLLSNINTIKILGDKIIDIESITNNSEKVSEKSMFVAIKGINSDGHNYIDQAILNGAKCILCQIVPEKIVNSITYIIVKNTRSEYSKICSNFFDNPGMDYAHKLESVAEYYIIYNEMMNFWREKYPTSLIEIDYDKFVLDYEKNSKLLIEKIGLSWEDEILKFHEKLVERVGYGRCFRILHSFSQKDQEFGHL